MKKELTYQQIKAHGFKKIKIEGTDAEHAILNVKYKEDYYPEHSNKTTIIFTDIHIAWEFEMDLRRLHKTLPMGAKTIQFKTDKELANTMGKAGRGKMQENGHPAGVDWSHHGYSTTEYLKEFKHYIFSHNNRTLTIHHASKSPNPNIKKHYRA